MRVVQVSGSLSQLIAQPKPTLLVEDSQPRAVVVPMAEYERIMAVWDWHERMLRGA